jgi:tetratricopeptide (TPR) repeat protein
MNISSNEKDKLYRTLINIYLDRGDCDKAQKICKSSLKEDPANIQRIVDLSHVMRQSGNTDGAISILNNAKSGISEFSTTQHLVELADEFFILESFEESKSIYEKFVDTTQNTKLTHRIVESYYRCEEFPDDFDMKLNLAVLNLRCDNLDAVDEFLKSRFDIDSFSFGNGIKIAHLFGPRGLVKKSIEILYKIRRKFFDIDQAHLIYINAILNNENEEWLDRPTRVDADTVVWIEDQSGVARHHIIENRKDADMGQKELNIDHPLSQKLLEHSVGDTISYTSPVSEEILKISKIENKYIYQTVLDYG